MDKFEQKEMMKGTFAKNTWNNCLIKYLPKPVKKQ